MPCTQYFTTLSRGFCLPSPLSFTSIFNYYLIQNLHIMYDFVTPFMLSDLLYLSVVFLLILLNSIFMDFLSVLRIRIFTKSQDASRCGCGFNAYHKYLTSWLYCDWAYFDSMLIGNICSKDSPFYISGMSCKAIYIDASALLIT